MEIEAVKTFLNQFMEVGIERYDDPNNIFWYHGQLIDVNRYGVVLATRNGFQRINFEDIKIFRRCKRRA